MQASPDPIERATDGAADGATGNRIADPGDIPHAHPPPDPASPPARTWRLYWEDFPAGHSMTFGAMPVTREAVIEFARQFDPQPFHLDDEAGRESLFGGLCASGWHSCAMAMRMMCDAYLLDAASLGSPGIDALRWLKPVFPGDVLSLRMEVRQARPMASKPQVGLIQSVWTLLNQHAEPVLTMEGWGMFRRRPAPLLPAEPSPGPALGTSGPASA